MRRFERTAFKERAGAGRSNMFGGTNVATAPSVAKIGYEGLMKGMLLIVPGVMNLRVACRFKSGAGLEPSNRRIANGNK